MNSESKLAPVVLWSDAMHQRIAALAGGYPRKWYLETADLCQEAYLAVSLWQRVNGESSIPPKLLTRVVRCRFHVYRRSLRRMGGREPLEDIGRDIEGRLDPDSDAVLDVRNAIKKLPYKHRRAVKLRAIEYRSLADLVPTSGSMHAARAHVTRGYSELRDSLAGGYGPAVARTCAKRRKNPYQDRRLGVNWSEWGRIPDQRDDD